MNLASEYRGGERQTELLIRELAGRGWQQRLLACEPGELLSRCADVENLECVEVARNPLAAGWALRGSTIAHSHEARSAYSGLLGRSLFGIPYLLTRRVVVPKKPAFLRDLAYRRATSVVGVSSAVAENLQARYPDLEVKVIADAHAGFESDDRVVEEIRSRYPGKTLIGHMGALDDAVKGQSTIIAAARLAAEQHPDWHFLLCGCGPDEQRFRDEIGSLQNIELVGWVDNVGDYLASFDLFVFPSISEALGSAILDAMQFGLPVVASNAGGIPDIVKDGENGRLIEPRNAGQLQNAIESILLTPGEIERIRQANRRRASQFSAAAMADGYERLYRNA
ncbi:MAG: glycosyltransferase family 4 protein [Woeseiaceae bacterium]